MVRSSAWYSEYGLHESLIDILADIRHVCEARGFTYESLDKTAGLHFEEERRDA